MFNGLLCIWISFSYDRFKNSEKVEDPQNDNDVDKDILDSMKCEIPDAEIENESNLN